MLVTEEWRLGHDVLSLDVGLHSHQQRKKRKLDDSRGVRPITSAACLETHFTTAYREGGDGTCVSVRVSSRVCVLMCWRVCLYFHVCVGLSCNLLSHGVSLGLFCMCVCVCCSCTMH